MQARLRAVGSRAADARGRRDVLEDLVFGPGRGGRALVWIGNGVLDSSLEDESLFGEFLRTPVSEGGVESLVVGPPHIVVEVGA